MAKPPFNQALGAAALTRQSRPPARFEGVTARVFPLKANMNRLRTFCDSYLNVAPEIAEFRPMAPYVLLMVLDYGKMAAEFANMGWVSQREVAFAVPLEWYDKRDGIRFVDFAAVCPFIYVDDETSLSTGREVFGWPKVKVWASREVNPWVYNPLSAQCLLTLSTMVHPELYAGERQEPRVLLEVLEENLSPFSRFPVDPSRPTHPFSMIPEALQTWSSLAGSWLEMIGRPPLLGYGDGQPTDAFTSFLHMARAGMGAIWGNPSANNITLKQFQDSFEPDTLCYQALVNSKMVTDRFNAGGPLGDRNLLLGDPSGGYRVVVHRYEAQPIVESLGLEVSQQLAIGESAASVLKPVFPFWVDVDLNYGVDNEVLCWRTKDSPWHQADGDATRIADEPSRPQKSHRYNTTLGGALQGVAGPFDFPDVTMRVLPLLAEPEKLKEFCTEYLENDFFEFEPWGRYVYLVVTSYEEMSSETNNIGWWADREVTFFLPVKQRHHNGDLVSLGIVPVFPFVNTTTAAVSSVEVQGFPAIRAELESPREAWMYQDGPSETKEQTLVSCKVSVFPAIGLGQQSEERALFDIRSGSQLPYEKGRIAADWGLILLGEHRRLVAERARAGEAYDAARALSLEILAHQQPINHISLKQFRDAQDPDRACFQSIIRTRRMIDSISDLQEIDPLLHVQITQLPSYPIVERLGLVVKWSHVTREGKVDVLQPQRPFWMKGVVWEELGEKLCWRAGSETWKRPSGGANGETPSSEATYRPSGPADDFRPMVAVEIRTRHHDEDTLGYFESQERPNLGLGVLDELGTRPEQYAHPLKRRHLRATALEFLRDAPEEERLTCEQARDAVECVEPQMIIESILSAEWEHWGSSRWYERAYEGHDIAVKPDFCIRTDSLGEDERHAVRHPNESTIFRNGWATVDGLWYSEEEAAAAESRGPALNCLRETDGESSP